jgi:hypothetical protein
MAKSYTEVNLEIIKDLKAKGFTSVQLVLLDPADGNQAVIELIPGKGLDFELDLVSLESPEIYDYIDGYSPMAKYIIDQDHLTDPGTG